MSDRIRTLTIILEDDYREDSINNLLSAIELLKGVSEVKLGEPIDGRDYAARQAVKHEIREKIYELYKSLER